MRWRPSHNTTIDWMNNYQVDNYPGTAFQSGTLAGNPETLDPFSAAFLERGEDVFTDRTVVGSTLIASHRLNETLQFTSISAFRRFDSYESFDADGSSLPALWFAEEAFGDQLSQELRLNIDLNDRFAGFAGIGYFWEKGYQKVPFETDERSLIAMISPIVNEATGGVFPVLPLKSGMEQSGVFPKMRETHRPWAWKLLVVLPLGTEYLFLPTMPFWMPVLKTLTVKVMSRFLLATGSGYRQSTASPPELTSNLKEQGVYFFLRPSFTWLQPSRCAIPD